MSQGNSRRNLLAGAAAAGAGLLTNALASEGQPAGKARPSTPSDSTKLLGRDPRELGERSPFVEPRRHVGRPAPSGESETPLQDLSGIVTPADLHYERHHAGVPAIDPDRYTLLVHGMVERPTVFELRDLTRFPSRSELRFLECSGNGRTAYMEIKPDKSPQQMDGLTSTSEWTGVPLRTLFNEVGVKPGASWFLAESHDGCVYSRSIPLSKGLEDAMIAYGQNGEPLRPEQGYPARLLLPGWEGSTNIKWIRRIEVADRPFMTREETSKYTDPLANGTARIFSFVMDAKSTITFPTYPSVLPDRGFWEISGLAWSGRGRIVRVDVSTDGGRRWQPAELQDPVLPKCHTRFRHPWEWDGRETLLMSRAVDETGYVQPTLAEMRAVRGAGTTYHFNHIRAWRVHRDGHVSFGLEG
jgi:sulfane dehydrogenase subunit SoxC